MTIELPEELKIFNVKTIWDNLLEATMKADKGGREPIVINADKLRVLDGAGLQILSILQKENDQSKRILRFQGFSKEIRDILESYGFIIDSENSPEEAKPGK